MRVDKIVMALGKSLMRVCGGRYEGARERIAVVIA
jgi:hypothetical protein